MKYKLFFIFLSLKLDQTAHNVLNFIKISSVVRSLSRKNIVKRNFYIEEEEQIINNI